MNSAKLKRMGIDGKTDGKMYGAEAMPPMMDTTKPMGGKPGKKRFATGGAVLGDDDEMGGAPAPRRLDKAKRGKGGSTVNIVIAPQGAAGSPPPPPGGPQPGMVAQPTPPAPPQPQVPPAALAAMLGGAGGQKPTGLKTGGRAPFKRGGAVKRADGGTVQSLSSRISEAAPSATNKGPTPEEVVMAFDKHLDERDEANALKSRLPPEGGGGGGGGGNGANGMKRGGKACRATGGKVYDAGSGSGEGRLEKEKAYGKNARPAQGR